MKTHPCIKKLVIQCAIALMMTLNGCTEESPSSTPSFSASSVMILEDCEKRMGVEFPSSSVVAGYYYSFGMDDSIYLRLNIDSDDLKTFLYSSPFKNTELRSDRTYVHSDLDVDWWQPKSTKTFLSGQEVLGGGRYLNILIDTHNNEATTDVYLVWGET